MGILIGAKAVLVASLKYSKFMVIIGKNVVCSSYTASKVLWMPLYLYVSVSDIKLFFIAAYKHGFSKQAALRFFYVTLNFYSGSDLLISLQGYNGHALPPENNPEVYITAVVGAGIKAYNRSKRRQQKLDKVASGINETRSLGNKGRVTFHQYQPEKIFNPNNYNSTILRNANELDSDYAERVKLVQFLEREKKWHDFMTFTKKFDTELPFGLVTEEPIQKPIGFITEGPKILMETNKVGDNTRIDKND